MSKKDKVNYLNLIKMSHYVKENKSVYVWRSF